jgi:hypothetical protein
LIHRFHLDGSSNCRERFKMQLGVLSMLSPGFSVTIVPLSWIQVHIWMMMAHHGSERFLRLCLSFSWYKTRLLLISFSYLLIAPESIDIFRDSQVVKFPWVVIFLPLWLYFSELLTITFLDLRMVLHYKLES